MLFLYGGISIALGFLLEKKIGYINKLRNTKFGKYFLGSNKAILYTEMTLLMILMSLMRVLNIGVDQFDLIGGLVVGQLILIVLVANQTYNQ